MLKAGKLGMGSRGRVGWLKEEGSFNDKAANRMEVYWLEEEKEKEKEKEKREERDNNQFGWSNLLAELFHPQMPLKESQRRKGRPRPFHRDFRLSQVLLIFA